MRRKSLSRKLMQKLLLPIFATIIAIGIIGYLVTKHEIDEVYDSELITAANILWIINRGETSVPSSKNDMSMLAINLDNMDKKALEEYAQWRAFRLWKDGKIVIASDNARPATIPAYSQGFHDFKEDGFHWRSFTLHIPEEKIIAEVAEIDAARTELIAKIAASLLLPLLLILPLIGLLLWRGVYAGLDDLHIFTGAIRKRSADDLTRIDTNDAPQELLPLSESLNYLMEKLKASLEHERMLMDNAAHELRTPIAALRIQTDLVLAANNEAERIEALNNLAGGVAHAAKLVDQILVLGKIKHQMQPATKLIIYDIARQSIKQYVPFAIAKHIEISLTGDENLQIISQPSLILTMVNNIIENAIKYTPEYGIVAVEVGAKNGQPFITITDSGCGIPREQRQKVFERFYRISSNQQVGSGLGLAIVKQIADMLQIHIKLDAPDNAQGLRVSLYFSEY